MMKKTTPLLLLTLALLAVGCNTKTTKTTDTTTYNPYTGTTTGTTTAGTTAGTGGTTGTTTGGIVTGPTGYNPLYYTNEVNMPGISCPTPSSNGSLACTDFDSVYSTIPTYPIAISGGKAWGPGLNPSGNVSIGSFPSISEMVAVTQTDELLRVRFRVRPQPKPTKDREYCYGRASKDTTGVNQNADYCTYTKLTFLVGAVLKDTWQRHLNGENVFLGAMKTVSVAGSATTEGISSGNCSVWYDLDHTPGLDYVIVVKDISSNNECRYRTGLGNTNHISCPNNTALRSASCASMEMQIQTDYTTY